MLCQIRGHKYSMTHRVLKSHRYNRIQIYIYIYIYCIHIYIYKIVLKTHLFCKIFRFLYRSFVSLIKSKETSNKNQHSN